jgi:hypothetical protein
LRTPRDGFGHADLREELGPLADAKADFEVTIRKIVRSEDIALLLSEVSRTRPEAISGYALGVLRRQADGRRLLAIGDLSRWGIGRMSVTRQAKGGSTLET